MRYSNVAWTENLALSGSEKISSSSDPKATNIQDLSSDGCLLDFSVDKNPNSSIVRPFVAPITSRAATLFITAPLTHITPKITPILTPLITSPSSTTSSLTAPPSITISPTPPRSIISNRPITRFQSRLNYILLNIPSTFLAQHTSFIPENLLITSTTILCLLASANSVEPYKPLIHPDALRDTSPYKLHWQAAMLEEFDSLIENKTLGLSATPSNRTTLGRKWVFKQKQGPVGKITRFKARCVIKGF